MSRAAFKNAKTHKYYLQALTSETKVLNYHLIAAEAICRPAVQIVETVMTPTDTVSVTGSNVFTAIA